MKAHYRTLGMLALALALILWFLFGTDPGQTLRDIFGPAAWSN